MYDSYSGQNPVAPQPTQNVTKPSGRANTWGRVAYISLFPACFLVPLWIILGGHGGWAMLIYMVTLAPFTFLYFIVTYALASFGPRKYTLSSRAAITLGVYYAAIFLHIISLVDGGDTAESIGSRLTGMGIPEAVSTSLSVLSGLIVVASMVLLFVFLIMDIVVARKLKRNQGASNEVTPTI